MPKTKWNREMVAKCLKENKLPSELDAESERKPEIISRMIQAGQKLKARLFPASTKEE